MTNDEFNAFCGALPATTSVVQWGGAHVWKVGAKVFAFGRWENGQAAITFKAGDIAFRMLGEQPGLRPAPYLASRGLKWIQHYAKPGLRDRELRDYLKQSYDMVVAGLSKKKRRELGLAG